MKRFLLLLPLLLLAGCAEPLPPGCRLEARTSYEWTIDYGFNPGAGKYDHKPAYKLVTRYATVCED